MNNIDTIKQLKISTARYQTSALDVHLKTLISRDQIQPAITNIVNILHKALDALRRRLDRLEDGANFADLTESEVEQEIQHTSKYIPHIYFIISLIENSDVTDVPPELTASLHRKIRNLFSDAELVIVSSPELNYSIRNISPWIRYTLIELGCDLPESFPTAIFRIAIPSIDNLHALFQTMLAHEIGHALYESRNINTSVFPIKIKQEYISEIYERFNPGAKAQDETDTHGKIPDEVEFLSFISRQVTEVLTNWVKEIAADLFALKLIGPAFMVSLVHFTLPIQLLDHSSESHPSPRFRLNYLTRILRKYYDDSSLESNTINFLTAWESITQPSVEPLDVFERIAIKEISDQAIVDKLEKTIEKCLSENERYDQNKYANEVHKLTRLANSVIPPIEFLNEGTLKTASISGILNAGWECYLSELGEYGSNLPNNKGLNSFKLANEFNNLLLKAMELNEIKQLWKEHNQ